MQWSNSIFLVSIYPRGSILFRTEAYKKLSLVYHPDKTAGMGAEQKEESRGRISWESFFVSAMSPVATGSARLP